MTTKKKGGKPKKKENEGIVVAMTEEEKLAWRDSIIASNLAQHYEEMAQHYMLQYAKAERKFWDTVKKRPHLPKTPYQITILRPHDNQLKIELITEEQYQARYVKKPPMNLVVDK